MLPSLLPRQEARFNYSFLVSTLLLVDLREQRHYGILYEQSLSNVQNMKSRSRAGTCFLAHKAEGIERERERGGWNNWFFRR